MIRPAREAMIAGAEKYIKDHAQPKDEVSKGGSQKPKAVLTIMGQLSKPGRPLSAILADSVEFSKAANGRKCELCGSGQPLQTDAYNKNFTHLILGRAVALVT